MLATCNRVWCRPEAGGGAGDGAGGNVGVITMERGGGWRRRCARVAPGAEERRIELRGCWWCWWPALRLVLLRGCRYRWRPGSRLALPAADGGAGDAQPHGVTSGVADGAVVIGRRRASLRGWWRYKRCGSWRWQGAKYGGALQPSVVLSTRNRAWRRPADGAGAAQPLSGRTWRGTSRPRLKAVVDRDKSLPGEVGGGRVGGLSVALKPSVVLATRDRAWCRPEAGGDNFGLLTFMVLR